MKRIASYIYNETLLHEHPVLFDIGARVGEFSIPFYKAHGGRIECYEPSPRNVEELSKRLGEHDVYHCIHSVAVSDHSGSMPLHVWDDPSLINASLYKGKEYGGDFDSVVEVGVIPFSSLLNTGDFIDVVKMNIEGAEYDCIMSVGAKLRRVGQFLIQVHGENPVYVPMDLVRHLESVGFVVTPNKIPPTGHSSILAINKELL